MSIMRQDTTLRRWVIGLGSVAFLFLGSAAHAAATAGSCAAAKQKLAGKNAAGKLGCYAKATKAGAAVDADCLLKVTEKFAASFAKIEGKGACVTPGYAPALQAIVDSFVVDMSAPTTMPPASFPSCAAAKQKTAGKSAASRLGCHAKATKAGASVDAGCLSKAAEKFAAAYAKEEDKTSGGCAAFAVTASIDARVNTFVAHVLNATPVVAPLVRCCANAGSSFCADLTAANESQCAGAYTGTLAGPGQVCDGFSGTCVETRAAAPTGCCDGAPGPGQCFEGPGAAAACTIAGGTYHPAEKCLSSGTCGVADEPGDTGPWAVGHRQLASIDTSRIHTGCLGGSNDGGACTSASACPDGSCVNAPLGRSLPLEVWYPVDPADAFGPITGYPLAGIVTLASELAHENAPVSSAGPRPLVVFSHGSGGIAIQSVHLMERLASHGFVVVAPNHTGNSQFDTTKVCVGGSNNAAVCKTASMCPGGSCAATPSVSIDQALLDRVPDVSFVIDHMTALDATPDDPFEGRIDELNVGVAGHSLGGFTALAVKSGYGSILPDARVSAIMPIAPAASAISDTELGNVAVPTLFMTGTLDSLLAEEIRAYNLILSAPNRYRADVVGAVHTHFANICDIANALIAAGFGPAQWPSLGAGALVGPYNATCIPPAFSITEATRLLNLYATAFFRRHMLAETGYAPFLTTAYATSNEPDIDFITP